MKLPTDPRAEVIGQAASAIPFLIKTAVIGAILFVVYGKYTKRFQPWDEKPQYGPANITEAQAQSKAEIIANSDTTFGNDFQAVSSAMAGLNYNGFVRLHNAFGKQSASFFGEELDLIGWLKDNFNDYEMQQLSTLTNGVFF
ncbi:MAG TPA: hypothetical protein VF581_07730 [Flavobacterium sp.]|jgi:hypothetical protein